MFVACRCGVLVWLCLLVVVVVCCCVCLMWLILGVWRSAFVVVVVCCLLLYVVCRYCSLLMCVGVDCWLMLVC